MDTVKEIRHRGPHLGLLAIIFMILFITGLYFVVSFRPGAPHYPGPWDPEATIISYFQSYSRDVFLCALFQFASAIPLGIFTASVVSRIYFLGSRASGNNIALFGGFMAASQVALTALMGWALAFPGIASDGRIVRLVYYIGFAMGGVGYSVPLGLLIAGISVTSWFLKALPKWVCIAGIVLAVIGEFSFLSLAFPNLVYLIPLTRFPGFIWLILAGMKMPDRQKALATHPETGYR